MQGWENGILVLFKSLGDLEESWYMKTLIFQRLFVKSPLSYKSFWLCGCSAAFLPYDWEPTAVTGTFPF